VVEDDTIASKLLTALNKDKGGRVTFIPLNRLERKNTTYPADVTPLISKLKFEEKFTAVFQQVFGKTIVCDDLVTANTFSKQHSLNAITIDGDRVDRKGSITGGFVDGKKGRLSSILHSQKAKSKLFAFEQQLQNIQQDISKLDQSLTTYVNEIQRLERERRQLMEQREPIVNEINKISREITTLGQITESKEESIRALESGLKNVTHQIMLLNEELKTKMTNSLTSVEQKDLSMIGSEIEDLKAQLKAKTLENTEVTTAKTVLENELNLQLKRKYEEIKGKVSRVDEEQIHEEVVTKKKDLGSIKAIITTLQEKESIIDTSLDQYANKIREHNLKIENMKSEAASLNIKTEEYQQISEKLLAKKSNLSKRMEDITKQVRDLGGIPDESTAKYAKKSTTDLMKQLQKVNDNLKKYSHVNKKAFEQYTTFTNKRDTLRQRKAELDEADRVKLKR
jgi:structural maintenance of chromosome 3 (chondroitin sulfate proteoglycan 6)